MFSLSLTIDEIFVHKIFVNHDKCENFSLENEGQGQREEKLDFRHSTRNVRVHIRDDFENVSYAIRQDTFTQKKTQGC